MLRDKKILIELGKRSVRASDYYHYKLYNPHSYDRLNGQADISLKVAITKYTKILKRGGYNV